MKDFGYDVGDYCDVDPMFGTLADFERAGRAAHSARAEGDHRPGVVPYLRAPPLVRREPLGRADPRADWYVWADPRPDGTPPNNWLSFFGGPAWTWEPQRRQYYLHNFLPEQPTLNLQTTAVVAALD